jgi:protein-disulfide isomerase
MAFLQNQKKQELVQTHIAKLTKSHPVEVYFEKPKTIDVEIGNAPVWGKDSAPVTIVEFSDFQCPYCQRAAQTVTDLKKKYGKSKIKVAFRHFPLPMHREAIPAAEASECVKEQGADKFWKFHDVVFAKQENQAKLGESDLAGYAKAAGANVDKFNECFKAHKYADAVQKDMQYGEKIGVKSTPTFFVNGNMIAGAQPIDAFSDIIDEELEAKK